MSDVKRAVVWRFEVEICEPVGEIETGIVVAKDLAEAVTLLEEYYGDEMYDIKCLRQYAPEVQVIPEELINEFNVMEKKVIW
nr:MAG TPA: hypothetical protein [Caudoviricetes sp.]